MFNIRAKIVFASVFFLLMALLPIGICSCNLDTIKSDSTDKTGEVQKNDIKNIKESDKKDKSEILCGLVAAEYKTEFDDAALEAIAILMNTNYTANPDKYDLKDKTKVIFEDYADGELKKSYNRIRNAVKKGGEIILKTNNEIKYIPYSISSNGYTVYDKDYSYIRSVASPWDCFSSVQVSEECVGVSLCGINYLCKNGATAQQALLWYLPDFSISKTPQS